MKKIVVLGVISALAGLAHASDWYAMNTTQFGFLFVDKDSLVKDGSSVKAWTIQSPKDLKKSDYVYTKELIVFDCKQKTFQVKQASTYDENEAVMPPSGPLSLNVQEIVPDSKEQWFSKFACNPDTDLATKNHGTQEFLKLRASNKKARIF